MKKYYCLLAVVFLIWPLISQGRTNSGQGTTALKLKIEAKTLIKELETSIPAMMREANIPGLQVAVVRDGKLLWHGAEPLLRITSRWPTQAAAFLI